MNDSKDYKAAAEPPLGCDVVPDWVGAFLNRRAAVEQTLLNCAAGRQPLPTAESCRELALKLGVPEEYRIDHIKPAPVQQPAYYTWSKDALAERITTLEKDLAARNLAARKEQLMAVLKWRMCSDPWPGGDMATVDGWLDETSRAFGFAHWVDAYHGLHK